jgi:hypothetical protein
MGEAVIGMFKIIIFTAVALDRPIMREGLEFPDRLKSCRGLSAEDTAVQKKKYGFLDNT